MKTLILIALALFLNQRSNAYSCGQDGLVNGTLCSELTNNSNAVMLLIGSSVSNSGLLATDIHRFNIRLNNQKVDQGFCKGVLATESLLLGPADCSSSFAHIQIRSGGFNGAADATMTLKNKVIKLNCINTCISAVDFQ